MELREYFTPLLKWWWLIVAATAVAGGASLLAARQQPDLYRSSTTLMVGNAIENPNPTNNDLFLTQQLAAFYVSLAERSSVRNDARQVLELDRLPGDIVVRQLNNTNIIEIIVTDTDPIRAQAVATELARQLIRRGPSGQEQEQAFVSDLLANYETAITETREQIATKQEELGELVSAREIARVQNEIGELQSSLRTLETNYTSLRASTQRGATNTIRVIEPAYEGYQVQPNSFITIVVAGGIGFVLAASAAYVLEYLDDTVRTPEQIDRITNLPTLAGIAQMKGNNKTPITLRQPRDPVSEAFRVLRTNIQFANIDHPHRTLLITSSVPMEGKSVTVSNLSVVLAQAGHKVLVIDADLRRPSQHEIFDTPNRRGLTDLLLAFDPVDNETEIAALLTELTQKTSVDDLVLLPSGPPPPNPSELLGSEKMNLLIETLLDHFDYLLFDSPPILSVTDAAVLGTIVDGTLLVVRSGKSRKNLLERSAEQLEDVHANVLGCILNGLPPRSEGFSAHYYYQDPYHNETADSSGKPDGKLTPLRKWRDRLLRRKPSDPVGQQQYDDSLDSLGKQHGGERV